MNALVTADADTTNRSRPGSHEPASEPLVTTARLAATLMGASGATIGWYDRYGRWRSVSSDAVCARVESHSPLVTRVLAATSPLVIEDTAQDSAWASGPATEARDGVRFVAGVALAPRAGGPVGALLVMDTRPRRVLPHQVAQLNLLRPLAESLLPQDAEQAEPWHRAIGTEPPEAASLASTALEQRLADSERLTRLVTDSLPVRIAYADRDHRYRFSNLAHCSRFGRSRQEVLGRTREELAGATPPEVAPLLAAVLQGSPQRFAFDEWVDGRRRRLESQLIPDVDEAGAVRGYFSIGVDVTEHAETLNALRQVTEIIDHTTDYVVQIDREGQFVYMNPAARVAAGIALDKPIGQLPSRQFCTDETMRQFLDTIVPAVRDHGTWVGESVILVGGQSLPVSHMVIAHRDSGGQVVRYSCVMRDVAAALRARQELQRQTDILRLVTEAIPATVVVVDSSGRYQFANSAFARYAGMPRELILGRRTTDVLGEDEIQRRMPFVKRALAGETVHFTLDYPTESGTQYRALSCIPLKLDSGSIDGFIGISQDVTAERTEQARLMQLATMDSLTGLLNRAGFEASIEQEVQHGNGDMLGLLYIDLDRFKPVNDEHGHPIGDRVLQVFAQRLKGVVRGTDVVARIGGDEFAVLLTHLHKPAHAELVAQKVVSAASAPFDIDGRTLQVGASVGVAYGADLSLGWRDLIVRADAMLYRAKAQGRGRLAV